MSGCPRRRAPYSPRAWPAPGTRRQPAALIATLDGCAAAFPARKRITWAIDLDVPVGLTPGRSPGAAWTIAFAEHGLRPACPAPDVATQGWLLLVTVTNTGLTPIRGRDFRTPLAFRFPGREVCDARIFPDPADLHSGRQPPALPAAINGTGRRTVEDSSQAPGVALGHELLLNRNGVLTLLALLQAHPPTACPR